MKITDKNFKKEVVESDVPVFVEFWASWCLPCQVAGDMMDSLEEKYNGRVKVGKINVDQNGKLRRKFQIQGLPTFVLFKKGKEVLREVSSRSEDQLSKVIEKNI